ncbi:MAG: tripartite tricarboxylate transporter substrate binding protein [Pigmentiphaga sp.]|uniref:Bug family tripartite tricarboxylate transporter substrate binding protein n=1 Tax=Pigmentiphaga sp. TaxID=1977564 RepID=UPI0029BD67A8|nr:tripartite tricarboxylate transporter substrate binding protein [Pigmentiphaga sp.]MDX3908030.1 tripartite tricarboxylate transporter substrate binding protein [Pigmentiphaga sp.]
MNSKACAVLLAAMTLPMAIPAAQAEDKYPSHAVRVIVPFAPGGVVDVMGRILALKLTEATGQSFYVDNVGGAGGNIGARTAAGAPKDGYSIMVTSSSFVVNPSLQAKVPYDPVKDFSPITIAAASPNVLVVKMNHPAKTLKDLVEQIRKAPDTFSFGSAGIGTTPHLSGELFKQSTGLDIIHVPYTGAGPALQATVGGHTPITFSGLPPAVPLIKNKEMRALAVTSPERVRALPDVPTLAEAGYPGQEAETLLFVMAPAGTPGPVIAKLNGLLTKILETADVQAKFDELGFTPLATTPEQSGQRMREEIAKWRTVIDRANLRATAAN